eukprot:6946731-Pyramimonas_sp.AAC.1
MHHSGPRRHEYHHQALRHPQQGEDDRPCQHGVRGRQETLLPAPQVARLGTRMARVRRCGF